MQNNSKLAPVTVVHYLLNQNYHRIALSDTVFLHIKNDALDLLPSSRHFSVSSASIAENMHLSLCSFL